MVQCRVQRVTQRYDHPRHLGEQHHTLEGRHHQAHQPFGIGRSRQCPVLLELCQAVTEDGVPLGEGVGEFGVDIEVGLDDLASQ